MALVVVDKQLLLVLYLLDSHYPKQSHLLLRSKRILIRQVPPQVSRQVLATYCHLAETYIGLVARWGVVYHVSEGIRVVIGCVYPRLDLLFRRC